MRRGFSIVELIIAVGIASLLIVAVTVLMGRFFSISRDQFEQTRTTEVARVQLDRMTDTIRNARTVDCNGNGTADTAGEWWLQEANANRMVFYSNIDSDSATEKITYEKNGTNLERSVEQDTPAACTFAAAAPQIVATSLYNAAAQPLFEYIAGDGTTLPTPVRLSDVVRVRTLLIVDSDGRELETAAIIATDTTPRLGQSLTLAAAPTPPPGPTAAPTPPPTGTPPPPPPPSLPKDCVRTGDTVAGKKIVMGDGGCVYVNPTGATLVWRQPLPPATGWPSAFAFTWDFARSQCEAMTDGGRDDWRLASSDEYKTLTIPENAISSLAGFIGVLVRGLPIVDVYIGGSSALDRPYWTATVDPANPDVVEVIMIRSGQLLLQSKTPGRAAFPQNMLCVAPLRVDPATLTRYPDLCSTTSGPAFRKWCDEDEPRSFATYN